MIINKNTIVHYVKNYKTKCNWYKFYAEKKFCGITIIKEGFYKTYVIKGERYISNEEILENKKLYIENNVVYFIPNISLTMANNEEITKYFKTEEALDTYVEECLSGINWLR